MPRNQPRQDSFVSVPEGCFSRIAGELHNNHSVMPTTISSPKWAKYRINCEVLIHSMLMYTTVYVPETFLRPMGVFCRFCSCCIHRIACIHVRARFIWFVLCFCWVRRVYIPCVGFGYDSRVHQKQ